MIKNVDRNLIERDRDLHVVGIATNGREALKQVAALHPDVVTLDVAMPVMDGLECLGNEGQGTHGRRSEPHECYEFV